MGKILSNNRKRLLELSDLWRRYDQVYSHWTQKHGVSTNAMTLIEEMSIRPEGVEPAEIADYLGIPRQTMTATLDGLEKRGLLERCPHEKDRRRKIIRFTEKGRELASSLVGALHDWEENALLTINSLERERTFRTVKRLCDALESSVENMPQKKEEADS